MFKALRNEKGGFEFTVLVDVVIANSPLGTFYTDRESYNELLELTKKIPGTSVVELTEPADGESMIKKLINMNLC